MNPRILALTALLVAALVTAGCSQGGATLFHVNENPPALVTLLPYSAKVGETIQISGQGFTSASTVSFNGMAATRTFVSATKLTATVPSGATTGMVTVTISNGILTSDQMFHVMPQITGFSPTNAAVGNPVIVSGVSLQQTTKLAFGGVAAGFKVNSDTQVTAVVPSGAVTGTIAITTEGGTATSTGIFTVADSAGSQNPGDSMGSYNTPIQHVIVVVQENRTPDNLFGSDLFNSKGRRLPDAQLALQGSCHGTPITLTPEKLDACFDPDHAHLHPFPSWVNMYDGGKMDGACDIHLNTNACQTTPPGVVPPNAQYTYVDNTPQSNGFGIVEPYFQIAVQYGYANYMFQTNQGPSFPAHQFLFSGTSAPVSYNDPGDTAHYWEWFVAENFVSKVSIPYGCYAPAGSVALQIAPDGSESNGYAPPGSNAGYPCYEHPTLTDLLESRQPQPVSWRYYAQPYAPDLWNAPNAIEHICVPSGGTCTGPDWTTNGDISLTPGQVLNDIANCQLRQVNWVIPDGNWSDHSGNLGADGGPSWVAAIVNAIGNSASVSNHKCDYWGNTTNDATAILITWDDWGGWYDHVNPSSAAGGPGMGYPNGTGQQYVYGFRVPLLVVSAYTPQGYVSGSARQGGEIAPYIHDFGSILNFIEYAFGNNGNSLGEVNPSYHYADYFAPDAPPTCVKCAYALSDFFNFSSSPRSFVPITGSKYAPSCFINAASCYKSFPMAPDNDAEEED